MVTSLRIVAAIFLGSGITFLISGNLIGCLFAGIIGILIGALASEVK